MSVYTPLPGRGLGMGPMSDCQILAVEKEQGDDATRDGCIGEVKDGAEEDEMVATTQRHPRGPIPFDKREVEHVHYPAVEQRAITRAKADEIGHHRCRRIVEDESVEDTVDNISCRTGYDKGQTGEVTPRYAASDGTHHVDGDKQDEDDAERSEQELIEEFPAKGHAVVLRKEQIEPIRYTNGLVEIHTCLYSNLYGLVDANDAHEEHHCHDCLFLFSTHLFCRLPLALSH